jgi:hypothetical protein
MKVYALSAFGKKFALQGGLCNLLNVPLNIAYEPNPSN